MKQKQKLKGTKQSTLHRRTTADAATCGPELLDLGRPLHCLPAGGRVFFEWVLLKEYSELIPDWGWNVVGTVLNSIGALIRKGQPLAPGRQWTVDLVRRRDQEIVRVTLELCPAAEPEGLVVRRRGEVPLLRVPPDAANN